MDPNIVYSRLRSAWVRFNEAELRFTPDSNAEKARANDSARAAEDMADAFGNLNEWLAKGGFAPDWSSFRKVKVQP